MLQKEEKAAQQASGGLQHTRRVRLQMLEKKNDALTRRLVIVRLQTIEKKDVSTRWRGALQGCHQLTNLYQFGKEEN